MQHKPQHSLYSGCSLMEAKSNKAERATGGGGMKEEEEERRRGEAMLRAPQSLEGPRLHPHPAAPHTILPWF